MHIQHGVWRSPRARPGAAARLRRAGRARRRTRTKTNVRQKIFTSIMAGMGFDATNAPASNTANARRWWFRRAATCRRRRKPPPTPSNPAWPDDPDLKRAQEAQGMPSARASRGPGVEPTAAAAEPNARGRATRTPARRRAGESPDIRRKAGSCPYEPELGSGHLQHVQLAWAPQGRGTHRSPASRRAAADPAAARLPDAVAGAALRRRPTRQR